MESIELNTTNSPVWVDVCGKNENFKLMKTNLASLHLTVNTVWVRENSPAILMQLRRMTVEYRELCAIASAVGKYN